LSELSNSKLHVYFDVQQKKFCFSASFSLAQNLLSVASDIKNQMARNFELLNSEQLFGISAQNKYLSEMNACTNQNLQALRLINFPFSVLLIL